MEKPMQVHERFAAIDKAVQEQFHENLWTRLPQSEMIDRIMSWATNNFMFEGMSGQWHGDPTTNDSSCFRIVLVLTHNDSGVTYDVVLQTPDFNVIRIDFFSQVQ
jgi:hypothetical protein